MSRRENAALRCARCRLHQSVCICDRIPKLGTKTKIILLVHHREYRKTTNTGHLACECLSNSEVWIRGRPGEESKTFEAGAFAQPMLLFPDEDAVPITSFVDAGAPVTLVVPDGNWRQAAKMRQRVPGLSAIPCVTLPSGQRTQYRLRQETRDDGLATFEAIARALGHLEGEAIHRELEKVFELMVERTLWIRGSIDQGQLKNPVAPGVLRHQPRRS